MALDSVAITAGSGTNIATDVNAGRHHQIIKLMLGLDDEFDTLVDAGQKVMASSVPVVIASDQAAAIDAIAGAAAQGLPSLVVRDDALTTLTEADGDWSVQRVTSTGGTWATLCRTNGTPLVVSAADRLSIDLGTWSGNSVNASDGAADAKSTTFTGPIAQCFTYVFNGTSWDRLRGDITNGLDVDVTRVQGNVATVESYTGWQTSKLTVTTTSAEVLATPLTGRKKLTLRADRANTADVAYSAVDPAVFANHPPLSHGDHIELWLDSTVNIYMIADSGSQTVWAEEYAP